MLPSEMERPVERYVAVLDREAPGQVAAVYLVGGLALGDFSLRHSNIDLVVVGEPTLSAEQLEVAARAERVLERARRPPAVWYSSWEELAEGGGPAKGAGGAGGAGLATPLTRAMLRDEAIALTGPDWPVVRFEEADLREWCRQELAAMAAADHGLMVMRHGVSQLVLQAARLAEGAVTGRVFSKTEAGHLAGALVPAHFRRILADSVGFRNGAHTSMYWGPFERKYDARQIIRHFAEL